MKKRTIKRELQPGLYEHTRIATGARWWTVNSGRTTLLTFDEDYARLWLSRLLDTPPDCA